MRKKIYILLVILLALTGCNNNNDTPNTENVVEQESNFDIKNVQIYTKDTYIEDYLTFIDGVPNEDLGIGIKDYFLQKLDEQVLPQIPFDETIRLEFEAGVPKDIYIESVLLTKLDIQNSTETQDFIQSDDRSLDFKNSYEIIDGVLGNIYIVTYTLDEQKIQYVFAVEREKTLSDTLTGNEIGNVTGDLTEEEQVLYSEYKKEVDTNVLQGLDPLTIVKFYIEAEKQYDFETAYSFLYFSNEMITKDEYVQSKLQRTEVEIDEFVKNLEAIQGGTFVSEADNKGYIEYELKEDHPRAINVSMNQDGIWKIDYSYINIE